MNSPLSAIVFDIQRFSLHDGPGIRTSVFFKGCPLHCAWCQNPESVKPEPEMAFYMERCLNCGACADICPRGAIIIPGTRRIDPARCDACGACVTACPSGALRLIGREWSPENLSAEVIKDREFFNESGGGVTLTGGEPLRNHLFLNRLCALLRERDIHITVETCGHFRWEAVQPLLPMVDLFKFQNRKTNPLRVTASEMWKLMRIVPFWLFRFMAFRAHRSPLKKLALIVDQLRAHYYLINEAGGISHFAPDYEKLLRIGTDGLREEAARRQDETTAGSESHDFFEGVKIICDGLARFGERYGILAKEKAETETDAERKSELLEIAEICRRVPRQGAGNFHEAVQSLFFAQIALNLESLDNSVCPGRMDQYLYPYYAEDLDRGAITRESAKELLLCFSIKMSEIIPVFSKHLTNFHGGMFNGQVVTVGGVRPDGTDGTNELSYLFLEIMDELRMRQPNYHARIHRDSPKKYTESICAMLARGSNSPALYCDEVIISTMVKHGYSPGDARDYTAVGCVEPVSQGRSFSSTDAAIFNVPLTLEMALNAGRRFGALLRSGAKTPPPSRMTSIADITSAFDIQLRHRLTRLIRDLRAVEEANRKYHPTPLTSALIQGCLDSGKCSTAGGAKYNFSGIQCVAPVDTGDSLYAIEQVVFRDKLLSPEVLVRHLKNNLRDESLRARLKGLEKFGNDSEQVDRWVIEVIERFVRALRSMGGNTRGGPYVTGLYSVTAHEYFGRITGATANGRRRGESFASGIAPENGMDRLGPTALFNSVNRIDFTKAANGINLNTRFDPHSLRGNEGREALRSLIGIYFRRGGMQIQINVLDPAILMEARNDPASHPNLLVRVSGYSAYFNDLTPEMKDEIIRRSVMRC